MANIIISESSGRFKSLYGDIQAPIASRIEQQVDMTKEKCFALKLFSEKSSSSYAEAYTALSRADEMVNVGEGSLPPVNSFEERAPKIIINETWKTRISVTREMMDDCKVREAIKSGDKDAIKKAYDSLFRRCNAKKIGDSYHRTVNTFLHGLLISALKGNETYVHGKKSYSTLCYDGEPVFSKNHKFDGGKKQCNVYSDEFSSEVLDEISTRHQNFKDDKGTLLDIAPNILVIPNDAALKRKAFAAVGSDRDPDTAFNGFYYQFGIWDVLIDPHLNPLVKKGAPIPYIILDSQFNEDNDGNIFQNRVDLEVNSHEIDGDINAWDGYARFSGGFGEYRQMIAGGVTWGEAL